MNPSYVIQIELDNRMLQELYPHDDYKHAYNDIRGFLSKEGLRWISGCSLFDAGESPIKGVVAMQHLSKHFDWFKGSLKQLRLLRVTSNSNLLNAI